MDNADLPGKPSKNQIPSFDDIPEAQRETIEPQPKPPAKRTRSIAGLVAMGVAIGAGVVYRLWQPVPLGTSNSSPAASPAASSASPKPETLLKHYPYAEAPSAELEPISADGGIRLRRSAAAAYNQMSEAALAEGVVLMPLSGFRSHTDQQQVFFEVKAERSQTLQQRAGVSAPPGYSEHHTGYAIDIGDGNTPATNLSSSFDQTAAFQWLEANAVRFNFEISFPKNNPQGVTYEPWHWRFVGDRQSLETFYKARGK
ncbi:MAG: D-alanyl-D-alanine carboxypeptidase family protein [Leptolyngbyaceae cyanobacterium CSU_1_3]|nr:D-alanyl-D-alanine carboxypeptidase family protein [Leptolyngbyaceae cyanobacterium CSU_1_3]